MLGDMEEVQIYIKKNIYFNLLALSLPNTDAEIHFYVFSLAPFYNFFSQNRRNRDIFLFVEFNT